MHKSDALSSCGNIPEHQHYTTHPAHYLHESVSTHYLEPFVELAREHNNLQLGRRVLKQPTLARIVAFQVSPVDVAEQLKQRGHVYDPANARRPL